MSWKARTNDLCHTLFGACWIFAALSLLPTAALAAPISAAMDTLTIKDMFLHAHFVVKAVMIFLGLCSIATFAILIEKTILFINARRDNANFLANFRNARDLSAMLSIADKQSLTGRMWEGAKIEYLQFLDMHPDSQYTPHQADRFLQRVALTVGVVQENGLSRLGRSMGILATIGSTSPFIGLFGTVWGILHSFAQIAASQSSSLAIVAPGIAEALLATAIGLFAAIPAVIVYNKFVRDMNHFVGALDNFAAEMITILSRKLDTAG